jgi:hypothetical protein
LVGHNNPSCFIPRADFHPAQTPEFVRINPSFGNLSRESPNCHHSEPTMLIMLHLLVNIISNHAPIFHPNSYEIPESLFVGGLAPTCLGFASCQNIGVELLAKFIQAIDFSAFRKDIQTIKVFHNDPNAAVWFLLGCLSIHLYTHEIPNLL